MRMQKWIAMLLALALLCAMPAFAEIEADAAEEEVSEQAVASLEPDETPAEVEAEAEDGDVPAETESELEMEEEAPEETSKPELYRLSVDNFKDEEVENGQWMNILLLGTDARNTRNYSRTDSMILLSVNAERNLAKMTSFMRDTWVNIPGRKSKAKLNAACVYGGPELTMRTLNSYFDLGIQYYVLVNLNCMAEIIDQLGGIRLDVTEAERKALNKGLFDLSSMSGMERLEQSGEQVLLNGNQAVAYSRIRKIDTDYRRTERQRTVLVTIAKRLQQEDPISLIGVISRMMEFVETNLSMRQILTLASVGLKLNIDDVTQLRVPIDGTYKAGMYGGTWCIRADMDENRRRVHLFIYGKS